MNHDSFRIALSSHGELRERLTYSETFLKNVQLKTQDVLQSDWNHVAVFAAGSLGRLETGRSSDLDVFFLAKGKNSNAQPNGRYQFSRLEEIQLFAKLIDVNAQLNLPSFSGDGRYLKVHELDRIISSTGDANDDSENLFTTRMLLLLESKSVWNDQLRHEAVTRVLAYYFKDGKGKRDFRPLFLLNDILRYWRTLCLNYERDRVISTKWWKTNLNLKFSRKLTVFSTVLLILTKATKTQQDFEEAADKVPLERLAMALDVLGDQHLLPKFQQFLDDYESFLAAKSFAELDTPGASAKQDFRDKADRFGLFLTDLVLSPKIDDGLRRYLLV